MKGYKHLTDDQKSRLIDVYRVELTVPRTAAAIGASANQVRMFLRQHGEKPNGAKGHTPCYQHEAELRMWALEGLSLSEMARRIGSKHQTVAKFLKRHDIPHVPYDRSGPNSHMWKGGRVIDKDGYVLLARHDHPYADRQGYVREHRLVMEQVLGRYLLPTEVVHHGERGRQDNDPSNLKVYESNAEHLAETLAGNVPQWTPEGQERIRAGVRRSVNARRTSNRAA